MAEVLFDWKLEQEATIAAIGNEYANFNLVIATPIGLPCESAQICKALKKLIEDYNRHRSSSIVYVTPASPTS